MRFRNGVLFVMLAVVWGSAFTAIKVGLEFIPPVLFAALRYDIAGVFMVLYAIYTTDFGHWLPEDRSEWIVVGLGGAFLIAAYHSFLFVGEVGTTSSVASIVVSLSPVLTTGFARVFLPDERLTGVGTIGLLLGFIGVGILSNPNPNDLINAHTVSLFFVFLAATSFAFGSVVTQRIETKLPVETMEAWSMVIGAILMHVGSALSSESVSSVRWTPNALIALIYLAVVASAIGFLIYFDLLDRLGPIEINLVSYVAPVAAAITGFLFLSETPTVLTFVGFGFILVGFILLKRRRIREEYGRFHVSAD